VPHYRKPVYNQLGLKYNLTLLHSGNPSVTEVDNYNEIIVGYKKISKFYFQKNIIKILKDNKYDVIIAMFDPAWISYMVINFIFPNKIIYWGHRYSSNIFVNLFRTIMMRICRSNILYSDIEVERMIASGIDRKKIFIANNTMLIPNKENCSNNLKDRFVFVGRAQKRKKVDLLITAFSNILNELQSDTKLYIIGEGKENDSLKEIVNKLSINERVIFTGAIHDNALLKMHFSKSYAYISPGPVGLGVLHSFAYGVPVVTLNYGKHGPEYHNIIDNENGLLFNDINELERIIVNLEKNKNNTIRLGSNAFNHYNNKRNIKVMVNGLIQAINYDY
jgi:glycosyltransferase involved in cell wall biosynthesis